MRAKPILLISSATLLSLLCSSCSSGDSGPAPGTPAFYWASAKQTFSSGDYMKASDQLDRALKSPDYTAKALPWALILNAGLVKGYGELADNFDQGARANRTNPSPFRRQSSDYRRLARPLTLQLAEKFRDFQKSNKDNEVVLAFPFPSGSQAPPPLAGKIVQGMFPPAAELEDAQKLSLARAMILTASDAAGTGEDSSKAAGMFKSGEVKVPRAAFLTAMARALADCSDLYGPKKLDDPERAKVFAETAKDALKSVPANVDVKSLNNRIDKTLKPSKKIT